MKINWGTGIVIAIVAFMSFILVMVIMMSTNKKFNHDLVTPNYYQKELAYQEEIDAEKNANAMTSRIKAEHTPEGIVLTFPEEMHNTNIEGNVFLYRPSNKKLDFSLPLVLSNAQMLIPENRLLDGRWNITVSWKQNGKKYMFKDQIFY